MSKRLTKVLSLILTLVMFLSVSTPAFAWGGGDLGSGWDREIGEGEVRPFDGIEPDADADEPVDLFQGLSEEGDIQVTVEAPLGALPSRAEVKVVPVEVEDIREAVEGVVEGEANILLAMDISFWLGDDEIEPSEPVNVKVTAEELLDQKNLTVVHIPDADEEEAEPETVDLVDAKDMSIPVAENEVAFKADSFSVYAVIGGSANDIKLTVQFFESTESEEPISTQVLVKEQFDEEGEKPLIDPGVPELTDTQSFEGWYIDDEHKNLDINGLNTYIHEQYGSITADAELVVYAMIYEVRYIVYHDQAGAVLRTQAYHVLLDGNTVTTAKVEINQAYVGFKGSQHFAGWVTGDKLEVMGDYPLYVEDLGTIYQNETKYDLNETLQLYPYLNTGSWLVFDNYIDQDDDSTSASYTSPVFYAEGTNTQAPAKPTRTGYEFKGWYKDQGFTQQFVFGSPIYDDTTVYAKWVAKDTTYHVVYWTQKVTDAVDADNAAKTYDFFDSALHTAHTGQSVSINVANSGTTADNRLGYNENGEDGRLGYYFVYNEEKTDTASKVVNGDGSTTLNVYYDRKVITFKFYESDQVTPWEPEGQYVPAENGSYYYYMDPNATGYYLIGTGPNATWLPTSNTSVYYHDTYDDNMPAYSSVTKYYSSGMTNHTYSTSNDYQNFSGYSNTRVYHYTTSSFVIFTTHHYRPLYYQYTNQGSGYYPVGTGPDPTAAGTHNLEGGMGSNTIQGLYGAPMDNWPNAGNNKSWKNRDPSNDSEYGYPLNLTEYVPVFTDPDYHSAEMSFYLSDYSGTKIHLYYVGQELNGTNYSELKASGLVSQSSTWYPNETLEGFTVAAYRFGTSGSWTPCTVTSEISISGNETRDLYVGFTRNTYKLEFYSNNESVEPADLPAGTSLAATPYHMPFAQYESFVPTNGPEGCYFDGWYSDPALDTPFDFSDKMPATNVRVYAKWTTERFRVVLDPTGGEEGVTAENVTFPGNQATTFRVDYGELIQASSINNAQREGYTLLGWYLDKEYTKPFNFGNPITDAIADMSYADASDEERSGEDPWTLEDGVPKPYTDADRPNVRGKVTIYASWRQDPSGIIGLNVRYDAVEGKGTINGSDVIIKDDPNIYADKAQAYAQPAAIPNPPENDDPEMKFLYWDILDKDGNSTGRKAYPGQTWEVRYEDAKEEAIDTSSAQPNLVTFDTPIPRLVMPGDIQPQDGPTRATSTYQRVTTLTEGKKYLITYTNGSTAYIMGNTLNSSNYINSVQASVSSNKITGDYDQYLFGVETNSSGNYVFGNLNKIGYLGLNSQYGRGLSLTASSSYNTWTLTARNYLQNTAVSTSSGYPIIQYNSGTFRGNDSSNNSYQVISFYELVEDEVTGEEFDQTGELQVGGSYIIAIGDYAVGNQPLNSSSNDHFILGIRGQAKTSSFVVPANEVESATWEVVSGDASNGFILRNKGNGTYLGMSSDGQCYLAATSQNLASHWTYDNGTDLNNHVEEANNASGSTYYYYLSFAGSFIDFTTSTGTGQGVKLYSVTKSYNVTFMDGHTNTQIEVQQVEEGQAATAPDAPDHTDEGWIFTGWDTDYSSITADTVVTAQYVSQSSLSYTVTFRYMDSNGEWVTSSQTVQHGSAATAPTPPTPPEGYSFNSWDKKFNNVTNNLTVNAVYSQVATRKFVVTLRAVYGRADAGSVTHINWYSNVYDGYGNLMPIEEDDVDYKATTELFPASAPLAEKTDSKATAEYEEKNDTIVYGDHGYNLVYDQVEIPESVRIPEKPYDIPGYTFMGWARLADPNNLPEGAKASDYVTDPADFNLNDDELYIKWVEDSPTTGHYVARYDGNKVNQDYWLVGYWNGADYSGNDYKFNTNGTLTVTLPTDAYVCVKEGSGSWYMIDGTFVPGTTGSQLKKLEGEKIFVPGNTEVTFTLTENGDGTVFLSYAEGAPAAEDEVWVPVTYVAANEQKPYHDMYAIWEGSFTIYHSGLPGGGPDGEPVNVPITRKLGDGFDLAGTVTELNTELANRAEGADQFLYGGYYLVKEGGSFAPPAAVDGVIPAYNGANWTWTDAETANGTKLNPRAGETYYIKEVPASKYLQPYFHFAYKKNTDASQQVLTSAWLISDIDDCMYQETGFVIVSDDNEANVVTQLTVENAVGGTKVTLKPTGIFRAKGVESGYLTYLTVMDQYECTNGFGTSATVLQYWVTPDGLIVTGIAQRTYASLDIKGNVKSGTNETIVRSTINEFTATEEPAPAEP